MIIITVASKMRRTPMHLFNDAVLRHVGKLAAIAVCGASANHD
jgi:hypothetical protein